MMKTKKTKSPAIDIGISGGERTKIVKGLVRHIGRRPVAG